MSQTRLPDGFIAELKDRLRLSDIVGRKVKLKRQGKAFVGLSPFTSEKTPSFYVHDTEGFFKCFSSGLGGDAIKFIQETERLSFMDAVEKLADEVGMALPKATPESRAVYDKRQRLYAACEEAALFFTASLHDQSGHIARKYLEKRGLEAASWARHRLGYAPDEWRSLITHLTQKGFSQSEIIEAGLAVSKPGQSAPYDRFRGRLIFPIADIKGRVIAFGGRALEPDAKPKYLNSSDTELFHKSQVLYRYKQAREAYGGSSASGLIVCEGYMDAIALSEAGFDHAVAPLGTALTEAQLGLVWRAGSEPILCFDGDAAGLNAAYRSIDRALPLLEPGKSLFFALMPQGLDPDDVLRLQGIKAMSGLLEASLSLCDLLWQRERDREALNTPERQAGLEQRLNQAVQSIQHAQVKSAYQRDLRERMRTHFWQKNRGLKAKSETHSLRSQAKLRGLGLIAYAIDNPGLIEEGYELLAAVTLPDKDVEHIRNCIFDILHADLPLDRKAVSTHLKQSGQIRALKLLQSYPHAPLIRPDEPEARDWLIALQQQTALGNAAQGSVITANMSGSESTLAWKRLHKRVAERQALKQRLHDADKASSDPD